jgi:hypothetical protein
MLRYLLFISFYQDQKLTDAFPCYLRKKQSLDEKEKNEKLAALPQIATFCVASAFGQFFIFMCVSDFGPLPCSIITTTRDITMLSPFKIVLLSQRRSKFIARGQCLRIRDPVLFFTPGSGFGIRDGKKSGSGIKICYHISDSSATLS